MLHFKNALHHIPALFSLSLLVFGANAQLRPRGINEDVAYRIATRYHADPEEVRAYVDAAVRYQDEIGIPAAVVLAIAIKESSFNSELYRNAGNPFGIKASAPWNGPVYYMYHDGAQTAFRVYENPEQAVREFGRFLHSRRWYCDALSCTAFDYGCVVEGLMRTDYEPGYSLDPNWGAKVLDILYDNELYNLVIP